MSHIECRALAMERKAGNLEPTQQVVEVERDAESVLSMTPRKGAGRGGAVYEDAEGLLQYANLHQVELKELSNASIGASLTAIVWAYIASDEVGIAKQRMINKGFASIAEEKKTNELTVQFFDMRANCKVCLTNFTAGYHPLGNPYSVKALIHISDKLLKSLFPVWINFPEQKYEIGLVFWSIIKHLRAHKRGDGGLEFFKAAKEKAKRNEDARQANERAKRAKRVREEERVDEWKCSVQKSAHAWISAALGELVAKAPTEALAKKIPSMMKEILLEEGGEQISKWAEVRNRPLKEDDWVYTH